MDARQLWRLSTQQFNAWRKQNDYLELFQTFYEVLPNFSIWLQQENLTKEIVFDYGFARFICAESPLLLCTYTGGESRLFDAAFEKLAGIRKAGWLTKERAFNPYFYWLKKNYGKIVFDEAKKDFRITSWVNDRPRFLNRVALLHLGGIEVSGISIAGRHLDFTCLDDLKLRSLHNNSIAYLWHCSARGLEIRGSTAFFDFYQTHLWDMGFSGEQKELKLSDGIFQDFHFKDCELRLHTFKVKLQQCSVTGTDFDGIFELTSIDNCNFSAGQCEYKHYSRNEKFYSKIKLLYSAIGKNIEAGEYFYKEKFNEMLSYLHPKTRFWDLWEKGGVGRKLVLFLISYTNFSIKFMNWAVWGFGERPFRSLIMSFATIVTSSLVYYTSTNSITYNDIITSLYYSIVTFTTLGYGDISQKDSILRLYSASEALVGMVLMGLFLAGYASKSKQY